MATRTIEHPKTVTGNGSATKSEVVELSVTELEDVSAKHPVLFEYAQKASLASLGLAATVADEVKDFWQKLFLSKLVARGEQVKEDAERWARDMQARFR